MAQERFRTKLNKGDRLTAAEMNDAFAVLNRSSGSQQMPGIVGRSFMQHGLPERTTTFSVEVIEAVSGATDKYWCRMRYFDPTREVGSQWYTNRNTAERWLLDCTNTGTSIPINIGTILSVWWHDYRRAFIPLTTPCQWFQLLTDLDGESYGAYANPGRYDSETGFLSDPHAEDANPVNSEWTVVVIDTTGQIPAWRGDWVQIEPLGFQIDDLYTVCAITDRASNQLQFWGALADSDLPAGGSVGCVLYINGELRSKTVHDVIMLAEGQIIPKNVLIRVSYVPNFRMFVFDNAPCQISS